MSDELYKKNRFGLNRKLQVDDLMPVCMSGRALLAYRCLTRVRHYFNPPREYDLYGQATVGPTIDETMVLLKQSAETGLFNKDLMKLLHFLALCSDTDDATSMDVECVAAHAIYAVSDREKIGNLASMLDTVFKLNNDIGRDTIEDLFLIKSLTIENGWEDSTPLTMDIFSCRQEFDLESEVKFINLSSSFHDRLIQHFWKNPTELYRLPPHRFEELIAEIMLGYGFAVDLTTRTRDGGKDIVAISSGPFSSRYLIECKRYREENKIDVGAVRKLYGVLRDDPASKGILVTTSSFTKPAQEFIDRHPWELEGVGFTQIVDWLSEYDRLRLSALK